MVKIEDTKWIELDAASKAFGTPTKEGRFLRASGVAQIQIVDELMLLVESDEVQARKVLNNIDGKIHVSQDFLMELTKQGKISAKQYKEGKKVSEVYPNAEIHPQYLKFLVDGGAASYVPEKDIKPVRAEKDVIEMLRGVSKAISGASR